MKKIFTFLFIVTIFSSTLWAQTSGGPDGWGYVWRDNIDTLSPGAPTYNWIDIVGLPGATQVKSLGDDNTAGPFPIGFDFHYYWYDRADFRIGSNGYIIFNNGTDAAPFPGIPVDTGGIVNGVSIPNPQDYIAVMASDITFVQGPGGPVAGADCWFYTTSGNDSLIISWISVPFWDGAAIGNYLGENTFQLILTSVDSSVTMQYKTQIGVYQNVVDFMTIGIENVSGTLGLQHTHDVYPDTNYTIKYYYPANPTFVVNDASTIYNNNVVTGALFISKDGNNFPLETEIQNTGNQALNPFNVTSQILNSAQAVVVTNTIQSDTLQASQAQFITHANAFTPSVPGVFTFVTNTQLANDIVTSNNQKVLELRVVDTTVSSIQLQYENNVASSLQSLSWSGGNGGAGYYFIPPFYPCTIDSVKSFVVSNINQANFFMEIYDDDGPFDAPGTRLDSQNVFNPQPNTPGEFYSVAPVNPITITSGGFYLSWNMDGDGIQLGTDQYGPFSNRSFEVLGNTWAIYRYRETQDLMIRAVISKVQTGVGVQENDGINQQVGNFYPNPSSDLVSINYSVNKLVDQVTYVVYDMQGRKIVSSGFKPDLKNNGLLNISTSNMKDGIYNCSFNLDGQLLNRRFVVAR